MAANRLHFECLRCHLPLTLSGGGGAWVSISYTHKEPGPVECRLLLALSEKKTAQHSTPPFPLTVFERCQRPPSSAPLLCHSQVSQLSGYVSEHSAYHHGEASLQGAIIGMAQDFCGSNNLNLLEPNGQFGTRLSVCVCVCAIQFQEKSTNHCNFSQREKLPLHWQRSQTHTHTHTFHNPKL